MDKLEKPENIPFEGENKEEVPERKELSKEEKERFKERLAGIKTSVSSTPLSSRDEKKEIKALEPGKQVGALVSLVFDKGIEEAVSVAKSLDNPAILDELHDILVDQYYEELVKKGIVKP